MPTLTRSDSTHGPECSGGKDGRGGNLMGAMGKPSGQLNPTWCEWFMGFPAGWTELLRSEMLLFRR